MKQVSGLGIAALASLCLESGLAAAPKVSEEIPSLPAESVRPQMVNLEVHARSASGEAVVGLSSQDLQVFEDGVPVEITHFDAMEGGRPMAAEGWRFEELESQVASVPLVPAERRRNAILVFVDNTQVSAFHRNRLFVPLADFLSQRTAQGDRVMVVSFEGSLEVRQPLTSDAETLREALEAMSTMPLLDNGPFARASEMAATILAREQALRSKGGGALACAAELPELARKYARSASEQARRTLASLGRFVDSLSGLPERKALLYVSDGLPLSPGWEAYELVERLCGGLGLEAASWDLRPSFHALAERANATGVSFYPLEAAGPRFASELGVAGETRRQGLASVIEAQRGNLQGALHLMALDTGGRAVLNTTEFGKALTWVGRDLDNYYRVGYQSSAVGDGRVRSLVVKARRQGLWLEHRKSLHPKGKNERLADRTLGTLLFGIEENPLEISVELGRPTALDGVFFVVPVRLRIPLAKLALLPEAGRRVARLTLRVESRDRNGRVAPLRGIEIPIAIAEPALGEALSKSYVYEVKMLMREGDHAVAVGLRDDVAQLASWVLTGVPVASRAVLKTK